MKPDLIVVGAGGHGCVVAEAATASKLWGSVSFLDDKACELRQMVGLEVVGTTARIGEFVGPKTRFVVAIGVSADRRDIADHIQQLGGELGVVVHPSATLSPSASIGKGTVVLAGAIIGTRSQIGRNVILNTSATIDHDCVIGDECHVSPGAHLAGGVTVGKNCWLGIGCTVNQDVIVGSNVQVGASAAVISDVPSGSTVVGVPARSIA